MNQLPLIEVPPVPKTDAPEPTPRDPFCVAIDGPDCSGKTSLCRVLREAFEAVGETVRMYAAALPDAEALRDPAKNAWEIAVHFAAQRAAMFRRMRSDGATIRILDRWLTSNTARSDALYALTPWPGPPAMLARSQLTSSESSVLPVPWLVILNAPEPVLDERAKRRRAPRTDLEVAEANSYRLWKGPEVIDASVPVEAVALRVLDRLTRAEGYPTPPDNVRSAAARAADHIRRNTKGTDR